MPHHPALRILHVVPSYLPALRYGGPIVSVHGLCKAQVRQGHDVQVYTTNVDGPGNSDVPLDTDVDLDGVRVRYFPVPALRRLYWSPAMGRALSAAVGGFDIVHTHSVFLWPTWAAARAARRARIPYVLAPRGMLVPDLIERKSRLLKTAWIRLIERGNVEQAAAIHATSALEEQDLRALALRPRRVCLVPNGVDTAGVDTAGVDTAGVDTAGVDTAGVDTAGVDTAGVTNAGVMTAGVETAEASGGAASSPVQAKYAGSRFVLFIGRVNWKKGLDRLIPAMRELPDTRLLIAGNDEEAYQPALEELAKASGVAARVEFLGAVHGEDKAWLLSHALALALPSYSENFGNVVLEAMAAGCPVAVTPEVGAATIVRDSGAGLVAPGEPARFGQALAGLIADPQQRAHMGHAGRQAVASHYSWDAIARAMEEAYRQILAVEGP